MCIAILTVFLRPANGGHALHDGGTVFIKSRHKRLAEDASCVEANVTLIYGKVHLPGQVVREVELVGGIAHGKLVQPSMAQANRGCRRHNLEGGVLRLVVEKASSVYCRSVRHVLDTFHRVGRGGVSDNPVRHVLHAVLRPEASARLTKELELFPLPVPLEPEAPASPGKVDGGHCNTRGCCNLAGRNQNLLPVDYHVESPVGKAGWQTSGAPTLHAVRVLNRDNYGVVSAVGVCRDDGNCSDVGDLGHGRDGRRNPHVEVHVRKVRKDGVPRTVFPREIELLAAESRHVRVTFSERASWTIRWGTSGTQSLQLRHTAGQTRRVRHICLCHVQY